MTPFCPRAASLEPSAEEAQANQSLRTGTVLDSQFFPPSVEMKTLGPGESLATATSLRQSAEAASEVTA